MATFTDLWLLNEAEAKRLTQRILDTERTLREQQLGLPGELPAMDLYVLPQNIKNQRFPYQTTTTGCLTTR